MNRQEQEQVAQTILEQLGGKRFQRMTGAKNFLAGTNGELTFKLPNNAKDDINYVRIALNQMDTYDIDFQHAKGAKVKTVSQAEGVYGDQLEQVFTLHTGLYTRLR